MRGRGRGCTCEWLGERAMGGLDEGAKEGDQEERREKRRGEHIRTRSNAKRTLENNRFSGVLIALKRAMGGSAGSRGENERGRWRGNRGRRRGRAREGGRERKGQGKVCANKRVQLPSSQTHNAHAIRLYRGNDSTTSDDGHFKRPPMFQGRGGSKDHDGDHDPQDE